MSERGAPTPVAWTKVRAPQSAMSPSDPALLASTVAVLGYAVMFLIAARTAGNAAGARDRTPRRR